MTDWSPHEGEHLMAVLSIGGSGAALADLKLGVYDSYPIPANSSCPMRSDFVLSCVSCGGCWCFSHHAAFEVSPVAQIHSWHSYRWATGTRLYRHRERISRHILGIRNFGESVWRGAGDGLQPTKSTRRMRPYRNDHRGNASQNDEWYRNTPQLIHLTRERIPT